MAHILVVDDNEQNLYLLETLLTNRGHRVRTACNGAVALAQARQDAPDIVITDILMPEMDGFTLCRHWKADKSLRRRPLIFYTAAYTDERDRDLARRLGADKFICKPARIDVLTSTIEDLLAQQPVEMQETPELSGVDEIEFLKKHNEVLVRKLEQKVDELQQSNQALNKTVADLQFAQARLRVRDRALASITAGIAIADAERIGFPVIDCNRSFERICRRERREIIGHPFEFLSGDDSAIAGVHEAMERCQACQVDLRCQRHDESLFWNRLTVSPVHQNERISHFVFVNEDISAALEADAALREQQLQLAHVSRVSTMGEMVGGIAHELNQPLYSIQNYSKACINMLARGDEYVDQVEHWLGEIARSAEHAGELLLRLRHFVTQSPNSRTPTSLREIIETAVSLVQSESQNRGVEIHIVIADEPLVVADSVQIQQVVINLLRNAFDALQRKSHGPPTIRIQASECSEAIEVTITDNGVGLPDPQEMRIFDAFQSTKTNGLGLGLAIGSTIVEAHQGRLWATSREEGGACFHFTLPLQQETRV